MSGMTRRDVSTAQLMKTHGYSARTDYHKDKQDAQAVRELAREILRLTRSTLLIHMRFLESALVRFVPGDETVTWIEPKVLKKMAAAAEAAAAEGKAE